MSQAGMPPDSGASGEPAAPMPPPQAPMPPPASMPPQAPLAPQVEAPASWSPPPPAPVPGAAGFVYADVPNRIIALIIDAFVLLLINFVIAFPLGIIGLSAGFGSNRFDVAQIVWGVIGFAISIAYFFWSWTRQRATVGMRLMGMQIGNAFDGRTLTTDQAVRRAIALWGPSTIAQFFFGAPALGSLLGFVAFVWVIYLLYTTATSPTKQGFHDKWANSVVVKAMRVA
jgi:uncharacterized RDD family membrane protein YckC